MGARVLLGLSALVWLPYGLFCLMQPGFLEGAAGLVASTPTATGELRAMYGGLQAALGVLCGLGCLRLEWRDPALIALGFLTAGLALARIAGVALGSGVEPYTAVAVAFEVASAGLAFGLRARLRARSPAAEGA
ncbi:MAG: DUF4345 family protein [Myxococcota bacterium]|nr:DUF4345 family protein [Myxococcota bacterium]